MSKITLEEVVTEAKKLVEEFGEDYKYEPSGYACVYQVNGEPSCIVGHLVNRLDPEDFPKPVEFENRDATESFLITEKTGVTKNFKYIPTPSAEIAEKFTDEAFKFLAVAQENQDSGTPWSESIRLAEEKVKNS